MSATVTELRAEYEHASFVPVARPRLSWKVETDGRDWVQAYAELEFTQNGASQTHRAEGAESVFVEWPFAALGARASGELRVRVAGPDGQAGDWSSPLSLRSGFLAEGDWRASFIELADPLVRAEPFIARRRFTVRPGLRRATLFATALGSYQAEINGGQVDGQVLKPGWTPYESRIIHETTDVTEWLVEGQNVIGAPLRAHGSPRSTGFGRAPHPCTGSSQPSPPSSSSSTTTGRSST